MRELEVQASEMAWDWDADGIDMEDHNDKLWVPVTAHTLNMDAVEQAMRFYPPTGPVMLLRQMTVYVVQPN